MIKTSKNLIESLIDKAITQVNISHTTQLVSMTEKIDKVDPVLFFEGAKRTGLNRTFWSSTMEDFYIVSIGSATEIIAKDNYSRATEELWKELLNKAIIHNPYKVAGTGLLAIGGMAFDPKGEKTSLWKNYETSQFTIPTFMLTKQDNLYYFTITTAVSKGDDPGELADTLNKSAEDLFTASTKTPIAAELINKTEIEPEEWLQVVRSAKSEIKENRAKKIVLAREIRVTFNKQVEITSVLNELIKLQANSYIFAFEHGEDCFIGATPERLVKMTDRQLLSTCLAGTGPRGDTTKADEKISKALLKDDKNLKEHAYVVKMITNKIKQYCRDIVIPESPIIYLLKDLQHLYTPVTAQVKKGYHILDIVSALHPTPALGGVPREASLAFIREHELLDRGWYGAPIGWFDSNENGEFAVAIRSALIQADEASLFAGCGIMRDSSPEAEYEETNIKFRPMLSALEGSV